MKRGMWIALLAVGCAAGLAWAGGSGGGGGGGPALTPAEEEGLIFMREEEKLARDVYQYFDELYNPPIFANIAASEQRHMDAILTLLDRYELADPAAGNGPGEFTDASLQALYDQLIAQGSASLEDAFVVGVIIEQTDIEDLEALLPEVVHNDVRRVYQNLLSGSENHLAAFQSQLEEPAPDQTAPASMRSGGGRQRLQARCCGACCGRHLGPFADPQRHRCCGMQGPNARGGTQGPNARGGTQCPLGGVRVEGVIASIDPAEQQLVVGDTIVVATARTVIRQRGQVIGFDELVVGQTVAACGVMDGEVLLARRITVRFCGQ